MSKLRIGIIGTGGIAHAHLNSYKNVPEVEVVAGADIVPGKAEEFFKRNNMPNAKGFNSKEEMFDNVKLDAVSVCTYNSTHSECAVFALENGLHVLCEKPMSVTLEQSIAMRKAEVKSGKILSIGFQPRYDANWRKIQEIITSGALGKIYYVQTGGGRRSGMPGGNFINKKTAGAGCLADIGCYSLDFAMHSIGYPKPLTVSATAFDYFGKAEFGDAFEVDDFAAAFVRLEGGITLDFRMSWKMNMDTTGDFIFLGTEAGLKIKQPNLNLWGGAWDGPVGEIRLMHDVFGKPTETLIPLEENYGPGLFEKKINAFIDAIINKKPAPIPTSQIVYNQAIIDGIQRSNKLGKEVDVVIEEI
ncbi:MAG: Gfo/Idh/MocA family oxidoreductase [Oscillospiraceae bacterium]|nr:Gfo/Idh/MocA family oxidoreductase [Oscillospiraceae bacterium]